MTTYDHDTDTTCDMEGAPQTQPTTSAWALECKCDCPDAELFARTFAIHYDIKVYEKLFDTHVSDNAPRLQELRQDKPQSRTPTVAKIAFPLYRPHEDPNLGVLGKDATDEERIANKKLLQANYCNEIVRRALEDPESMSESWHSASKRMTWLTKMIDRDAETLFSNEI